MSVIANLFGHSPVRPMQRHMKSAVNCAREVLPLIDAMESGDRVEIAACRKRIDDLEHEADELIRHFSFRQPYLLRLIPSASSIQIYFMFSKASGDSNGKYLE